MKIATMYFGKAQGGLARFRISRKHRLHLDLVVGFPIGALARAVFQALDGKTVREARELCTSYHLPFRISEMKHEDPVQDGKGRIHSSAENRRRDRRDASVVPDRKEGPHEPVAQSLEVSSPQSV